LQEGKRRPGARDTDRHQRGALGAHPCVEPRGDYHVERALEDRGGMAIVYLARHRRLGRMVALKQVDLRGGGPVVERFVREAKLAGSLAHPNVVTVYDFFEHDGVPYIAMEYVERGSVRRWMGRLRLGQVLGVLEGMLSGLAHAHSAGIVHRDIKPENVLVTGAGTVKIADFGIARAFARATRRLTATGMTLGTPDYMAPEQALNQEIGPRTDLYAVGAVAYELLLGRQPFAPADTPIVAIMRRLSEPIVAPAAVDPRIDPELAAWLQRLLARDPARRPADATAAWQALETVAVRLLGAVWRRDARVTEPPAAPAARDDYRTFVRRP
jgi:serine/threonine protein kinase